MGGVYVSFSSAVGTFFFLYSKHSMLMELAELLFTVEYEDAKILN